MIGAIIFYSLVLCSRRVRLADRAGKFGTGFWVSLVHLFELVQFFSNKFCNVFH